jgi:hypothetical protein
MNPELDITPGNVEAFNLALTLAKISDLALEWAADNDGHLQDLVSEVHYYTDLIRRLVNRQDLEEARRLLSLSAKVEETAETWRGPEDVPDPAWLLDRIVRELDQGKLRVEAERQKREEVNRQRTAKLRAALPDHFKEGT